MYMVMATKEMMEAPTSAKDTTLLHLTHVSVSAEWYSSEEQTRSALQPEESARGVTPGSQGVQEMEELEPGSETLLESHSEHIEEPREEENLPESQSMHVVMLDAAFARENFPASQSMHVAMLVAAGVPEYFPDSQSSHVAAVAPENFPETQVVHAEAPA
jgi:hypothetical protein